MSFIKKLMQAPPNPVDQEEEVKWTHITLSKLEALIEVNCLRTALNTPIVGDKLLENRWMHDRIRVLEVRLGLRKEEE